MRTLWLFPAVGILLASSPVQAALIHQWSKRFGFASDQIGKSVATDGSNNAIITGYFFGTANFGGGSLTSAGSADIFVAKFGPSGNHIWSKRFGDSSSQQVGESVAADGAGNVIVTGQFIGTVDFGGGPLTDGGAGNPDIFLAKLDAGGNHLWSKRFGGDGSDQGFSVAVDGAGNVLITGNAQLGADFGGGLLAGGSFLAKFDANGNHLWSKTFANPAASTGRSVAADGSGNVVFTGRLFGAADFGGGPLTSAGQEDIFVAEFDASGNHIWSKLFGDTNIQEGNSVATDGSNNVILTGYAWGTTDFGGGPLTSGGAGDVFLAKFDASGNHLWSQLFSAVDDQAGKSLAVDAGGNIVITGFINGSVNFGGGPIASAGGPDIFMARFNPAGGHLWSQRFGSSNAIQDQVGNSVAVDAPGNVIITGGFGSTVDFGGGTLQGQGGQDAFLVKFTNDEPVPVLISRFAATGRNGAVEITWDLWSDEALESFALYRHDAAHPQAVAVAKGDFDPTIRSYLDTNVEPEKTYHYELSIRTRDGNDIRSPVATVTVPAFAALLGQNFPNPFGPVTSIEYTLNERSNAVLGIYDAAGRFVARLDQGEREAGTYRADWNGRNASGSAVGSGVYFYRLEGVPSVAPKKMVRFK